MKTSRSRKRKKLKKYILLLIICLVIAGAWVIHSSPAPQTGEHGTIEGYENLNIQGEEPGNDFLIPEYNGSPYVSLGDVSITDEEKKRAAGSFIDLAELDSLGRCGAVTASLSLDTLPESDRESIGMVKPSGWHTVRYDDLIEDKYLYNRCHLIAHCLSGLNAEVRNLITGTRYMNVTGMLPFEIETVRYIERTGNHVFYRVTPVFDGNDLVCKGVRMEAYSIEDDGELAFDVFCFNIQPGISIDYKTGESERL